MYVVYRVKLLIEGFGEFSNEEFVPKRGGNEVAPRTQYLPCEVLCLNNSAVQALTFCIATLQECKGRTESTLYVIKSMILTITKHPEMKAKALTLIVKYASLASHYCTTSEPLFGQLTHAQQVVEPV